MNAPAKRPSSLRPRAFIGRWPATFGAIAAGLVVTQVVGCFTGSDGLTPPVDALYFPTGMLVSPGGTTLYVASSDFDLQYNGGSIVAIALGDEGSEGLRTKVERIVASAIAGENAQTACSAIGSKPNGTSTLVPGPCEPLTLAPFIKRFATIGAFASSMTLVQRPAAEGPGARLFVTVRGDPSVTYIDVDDDRDPQNVIAPCASGHCLECASSGDDRRCGGRHLVGESVLTSLRGLTLPTEPTGIAAAQLASGNALCVAHQTEASASLIQNRWDGAAFVWPTLDFTLTGLQEGPTGVVAIPPPQVTEVLSASIDYRPGFIVSHRAAATLSLLRYEDDRASSPPRPFLVLADQTGVTLSGDGLDSRGMAIDDTDRKACEALAVQANDNTKLTACAEVPLRFYVANRSPASLLVGTVESDLAVGPGGLVSSIDEHISLDELVPLTIGPSGVAIGKVIGFNGELETRVFVVSFDSSFVAVYDPVFRKLETLIRTGRGPSGLAFDRGVTAAGESYSHLYVGQFTDSYLSIVDLDTRRPTYGTVVLTAGPPVAPRDEQ